MESLSQQIQESHGNWIHRQTERKAASEAGSDGAFSAGAPRYSKAAGMRSPLSGASAACSTPRVLRQLDLVYESQPATPYARQIADNHPLLHPGLDKPKFAAAPPYAPPSFEDRLVEIEAHARRTMGTASLRGWETGLRVGMTVGGLVSLALAFVPGMLLPLPAMGTMIFLSSALVGALVGGLCQRFARMRYFRQGGDDVQQIFKDLLLLQHDIMAASVAVPTGQQVRQLRRIELLQKDIDGGFRHACWQVAYGITNYDAKLSRMLNRVLPEGHPDRPAGLGWLQGKRPKWLKRATQLNAEDAMPTSRPPVLRRQTQ